MRNKIAVQSNADHTRMCAISYARIFCFFCFRDLDFDLMTLIYELDLDITNMYLYIPKTKFLGQCFQKLKHIQTDRRNGMHYTAAFAVVIETNRPFS